jgi:quercetin dioxygenase-like cupin family protein
MTSKATTLREKPAPAGAKMSRALSSKKKPSFVEGRRSFFKYRDLGVGAASNGRMRAQVTSASAGLSEPTGWHYHLCEGQFVYMLSGWVELEFEDGEACRIEAGDSMFIPGGMRHNETRTSDAFELLEISVPADMGTKACDPPKQKQRRA